MQGVPVAVDPLVDKLKIVNESHAELASSALQLAYQMRPLLKAELNTMDKRFSRGLKGVQVGTCFGAYEHSDRSAP